MFSPDITVQQGSTGLPFTSPRLGQLPVQPLLQAAASPAGRSFSTSRPRLLLQASAPMLDVGWAVTSNCSRPFNLVWKAKTIVGPYDTWYINLYDPSWRAPFAVSHSKANAPQTSQCSWLSTLKNPLAAKVNRAVGKQLNAQWKRSDSKRGSHSAGKSESKSKNPL